MKIVAGLILAVFLMVAGPEFARADLASILKSEKTPHYDTLSQEQFKKSSDLYDETPYSDVYLRYKIRLPKEWRRGEDEWQSLNADGQESGDQEKQKKKKDVDLKTESKADVSEAVNRRVLGKIRRYYGPPRTVGPLSYIDVSAVGVEHNISLRNWFINYVLVQGLTLQGLEVINENRVEALYIIFDKDTSYVVRTIAEMNGARVVMVSYYLPEQFWLEERAVQEKVLSSFKFVLPEKIEIEGKRTYSFLEMLRLDYPSSWKLIAPNINSVDSMDARILSMDKKGNMNGEMDFHAVSVDLETTLAQEVGDFKDSITDMGFEVGDLIDVIDDYKFNDYLFFHRVEVYKLPPKKNTYIKNHELWLAVMAEDRYYYVATLVTPSREDDFANWARNIAAFKIVLESIRP